jgi:hypothetical protein
MAVFTREIDHAVVVGVDLVDHVLELRLGGVLSQTPHHGPQLLGGDLSYIVGRAHQLPVPSASSGSLSPSPSLEPRAPAPSLGPAAKTGLPKNVFDGITNHHHPCPRI